MSKAKYRKQARRKVRHEENASTNETSPKREKSLGQASRRRYGQGKAVT